VKLAKPPHQGGRDGSHYRAAGEVIEKDADLLSRMIYSHVSFVGRTAAPEGN